ncbi:PucR family transcriptional regulator [Nocardia sp. SYP-A9097]|uniref:PucR family transcriptional regulator n=1 Tax=Nocardia sp. SYP-A9097 TaxID=2663237 RepID=UPI00129BB928|nr:helix-turn-helix domain-containing protein [Nocardia sp. SYP-A9097]MRH87291.1 PucR family transcriptional regulator [Nocardia sp. SYP-A9097]
MSTAPGEQTAFTEFLTAHLPEVAKEMVTAVVRGVPDYEQLPAELLEQDLTRRSEENLRLFLRLVGERREPRAEDLDEMIEVAVRRAREGIPLDSVLAVYHRGALAAWNYMAAAARTPEQRDELIAAVPRLLGYLGAVIPGVAASYLRERQDLHWEQREVKRALAQALLQGKPAELLAQRFGIALGPYHVLALRTSGGVETAEGARPAMRVMHGEIDALSAHALTVLDRAGGWVLVPATEPAARLDAAITRIATTTGVLLIAGTSTAALVSEIPARAEEAGEIARLALGLGRPTGVYRMADLALQYQFARPGPARTWLLGLLAPLTGHPHLMEALRAYLTHDHNRVAAAESLVVHRNTLNYRLNRIATLTGYDPGASEHTPLFAAALTAFDLASAEL